MKKTHVVLIVFVAVLPFLVAAAAVVAFVVLPLVISPPPVVAVLVYETEPPLTVPDDLVAIEKLVAAVDRRVNPGRARRGRVRLRDDGRIEIDVYDRRPEAVEQIDRLIGLSGTLEFRILANDRDHADVIDQARQSESRVAHLRDADGNVELDRFGRPKLRWAWIPVARGKEGSFPYPEIATRTAERDGNELLEILVVGDPFNVDGRYLTRANDGIDQSARPCINFTLNKRGGQLFVGLTSNNLPDEVQEFSRKMGIILNGRLHSAPAIRAVIGEHGQITGDFTQKEVDELVSVLNSGALPAGLRRAGPLPPPTAGRNPRAPSPESPAPDLTQ